MALLLAAFGWGFRHGFDIDHLAAIGDLSTSAERPRDALGRSTWYAVGHSLVLLVLGTAAVVAGAAIPGGLDTVAHRVVGATLVALGLWTLWAVRADGNQFRLRSRWALLGAWRAPPPREVEIVHDHEHDAHGHHHTGEASVVAHGSKRAHAHPPAGTGTETSVHRHPHVHRGVVPAAAPTRTAAVGVGMLHGIGAETPTQVTLLAAAAGAGGTSGALAYLAAFVGGLFAANTVVAAGFATGVMDAGRHPLAHRTLGLVVGAASVAIGVSMVLRVDLVTVSLA
jgi:high-affinity nickel-transport protein